VRLQGHGPQNIKNVLHTLSNLINQIRATVIASLLEDGETATEMHQKAVHTTGMMGRRE
jgi:hypothetical protein